MNNLLSKTWFRIISIILIQAFLLLDIAWAGGTELSVVTPDKMLSPSVQISQQVLTDSFNKIYDLQHSNNLIGADFISNNVDYLQEDAKVSKWSWSSLFQKIADSKFWQWTKDKLDLLAQANSLDKKNDDDSAWFNDLKSIGIVLLVPAVIFASANLGWAGDGVVVESFNWVIEFAKEHWIVSSMTVLSIVNWAGAMFSERFKEHDSHVVLSGYLVFSWFLIFGWNTLSLFSYFYGETITKRLVMMLLSGIMGGINLFNISRSGENQSSDSNDGIEYESGSCYFCNEMSAYGCPYHTVDSEEQEDNDDDASINLKSILMPLLLAPALVALSSSFGWAGDGGVVESFNWIVEFATEHWIVSSISGVITSFYLFNILNKWRKEHNREKQRRAELAKQLKREEEQILLAGGEKAIFEKLSKRTKQGDLIRRHHIVEAAEFINKYGDFQADLENVVVGYEGDYVEGSCGSCLSAPGSLSCDRCFNFSESQQVWDPNAGEPITETRLKFRYALPITKLDDAKNILHRISISKNNGLSSVLQQKAIENYQQQIDTPDSAVIDQISAYLIPEYYLEKARVLNELGVPYVVVANVQQVNQRTYGTNYTPVGEEVYEFTGIDIKPLTADKNMKEADIIIVAIPELNELGKNKEEMFNYYVKELFFYADFSNKVKEIAANLVELKNDKTVDALVAMDKYTSSINFANALTIISALGQLKDNKAVDFLNQQLKDKGVQERAWADTIIDALEQVGVDRDKSIESLIDACISKLDNQYAKTKAAYVLQSLGAKAKRALPALKESLDNESLTTSRMVGHDGIADVDQIGLVEEENMTRLTLQRAINAIQNQKDKNTQPVIRESLGIVSGDNLKLKALGITGQTDNNGKFIFSTSKNDIASDQVKTNIVLNKSLEVLEGLLNTGKNPDENLQSYYQQLMKYLSSRGPPIDVFESDSITSEIAYYFDYENNRIRLILNKKFRAQLISVYESYSSDDAFLMLAVRMFHFIGYKNYENFYQHLNQEYELIKKDALLYNIISSNNLSSKAHYDVKTENMLKALNNDKSIIEDFDALIIKTEQLENEMEEVYHNTSAHSIEYIDDFRDIEDLEKAPTTKARNDIIERAFVTGDFDYFAMNNAKRLMGKDALKDTVLFDYLDVMVHRSVACGRDSFLYLADNPVTRIPFNQLKMPRVPVWTKGVYVPGVEDESKRGVESSRWARQYYAMHLGRRFSDGIGVTEAENGRGMTQRLHKHNTTQEFTVSLSDDTKVMWGYQLPEGTKTEIRNDGQEYAVDGEYKDKLVLISQDDAGREVKVAIVHEQMVPFGNMICMPKKLYHLIKNINPDIPSIDFTIKDPITQLMKTFSPPTETQLQDVKVKAGDERDYDWGKVLKHEYESPYASELSVDPSSGRMHYTIDEEGEIVPMMGGELNLKLNIVTVKPGQSTENFQFMPLKESDRGNDEYRLYKDVQIIRVFPWSRDMPENWVLDKDHAKIKAQITVYDKQGNELYKLEDVQGGDFIILDNLKANGQIDSFSITNKSVEGQELVFFFLEPGKQKIESDFPVSEFEGKKITFGTGYAKELPEINLLKADSNAPQMQKTARKTVEVYFDKVKQMEKDNQITKIDHSDVRFTMRDSQKKLYIEAIKHVMEEQKAEVITPAILFEAAALATKHDHSDIKARIGLQPGTMNPLHYGHISASLAGIISEKLDMVLLANGGTVPDKPYAASADIRNEMARIAVNEQGETNKLGLNQWLEVTPIRAEAVDMFSGNAELLSLAGTEERAKELKMQSAEELRRFNMDMAGFIWLFAANPNVEWVYLVGSDKVGAKGEKGYGEKNEVGLIQDTLAVANVKIVYFERTGKEVDVKNQIEKYPWLDALWKSNFKRSDVGSFADLAAEHIRKALSDKNDTPARDRMVGVNTLNQSIPEGVIDYITADTAEGRQLRYLYPLENEEKAADKVLKQGDKQRASDLYQEIKDIVIIEQKKQASERQADESVLKSVIDNLNKKINKLNSELLHEKLAEPASEDDKLDMITPVNIVSQGLVLQSI